MRAQFSVAANPDRSIHIRIWDDEAMANETEKRAKELGIEVTVSRECNIPQPYTSEPKGRSDPRSAQTMRLHAFGR